VKTGNLAGREVSRKESSEKISAEDAGERCRQLLEELWAECSFSPRTPFPQPVVWLSGAPGSGKGANANHVMRVLRISAAPVVVSELLNTRDLRLRIDHGDLVDDPTVIRASLAALRKAKGGEGLILDGYPRSLFQAKFLHLFGEKLKIFFQKDPDFRMVVFSVDEATSLERQLGRGRKAIAHNQEVRRSGRGVLHEVRPTDVDETLARRRYRAFLRETDAALRYLQSTGMPFAEIDSRGSFEVVRKRIEARLRPWSPASPGPEVLEAREGPPRDPV